MFNCLSPDLGLVPSFLISQTWSSGPSVTAAHTHPSWGPPRMAPPAWRLLSVLIEMAPTDS